MKAGSRLDICMVVGGMPFHGQTDKESSLGGSESAALYMARAMAKRGHSVTVFSNCPKPGTYDGVNYLDMKGWEEAVTNNPHDVLIVQRMPRAFAHKRASRLNICWLHDMAQGRVGHEYAGVGWNVDDYVVLSDYHLQQVRTATGLPESIFWKSRNGIDVDAFSDSALNGIERNPKRLIYAARPERGLDTLLDKVFPAILEKMPDVTLAIAGYENYADHMRGFYERISHKVGMFGDRIEFLGYLKKADFYKELAASALYVYPTPSIEPGFEKFNEISCIAAMETQAAGTPMVATKRGALPETLHNDFNVLVEEGDGYFERFADSVVDLLGKPDVLKSMSEGARAHALGHFSWDAVADEWLERFEQRIADNNPCPVRRFVHLVEQNDIVAARDELEESGDAIARANVARKAYAIYRDHYAPMFDGQHYEDRYRDIGKHIKVEEVDRSINDTSRSERFGYLMGLPIPENAKVLDYGCWAGHYAINLARARADVAVVGMDISPRAVDLAQQKAKEHGVGDRATFKVGRAPGLETSGDFDAALLFEVLEHVAEPWQLLDEVEAQCKDDALIAVTVPYGPWELMQHEHIHKYQHLWNFDLHDLREMLQNKRALNVTMRAAGRCPKTDEPVGWYMFSYRKSADAPACSIDLARKRAMVRPRLTISASMIIGGELGSNVAAWGIDAIKDVVDELVIADCGMNEVARVACTHFGARVVTGLNPNEDGFDAARNLALDACDSDFVFWVDGDERLVTPANLPKYLRENVFNAYQVVQNHMTIERDHDADLPARILRMRPDDQGRELRFCGVVHEHPEFEINEGPGLALFLNDIQLAHIGYMTGEERNGRFERNLPLHLRDREAHSERYLTRLFIMRENTIRARRLIAQAGYLTPEARELCEEAVAVGKENFVGKGERFARSKWLQYYSEALQMLGRGAIVAFGFAGGDVKAKIDNMSIGQFETIEEAERELCSRLRAECEKYFRPDW